MGSQKIDMAEAGSERALQAKFTSPASLVYSSTFSLPAAAKVDHSKVLSGTEKERNQ